MECSAGHLGKTFFVKFGRSVITRSGASNNIIYISWLLFFSGVCYEPFLLVAKMRFAAFLRTFAKHPDRVEKVWRLSVQQRTFFKGKTKGMVGLMQNMLHDLGWELGMDGTCKTPDGWSFTLWEVTTAQYSKRIQHSWENKLLCQLQQKLYLQDLQSFSVARSVYPKHKDLAMEGFINKMRLGGLFPNKRKKKISEEHESCCDYCGEEDTMLHRAFYCPATEHLRQGEIWENVRTLPNCQLFGSLFPQLPLADEYSMMLRDLKHDEVYAMDDKEELCFFTDGSALDNEQTEVRLCSWAVTHAVDTGPRNRLVALGLLPGEQQSVFRAELYAVNAAISVAARVRIFCDNAAVVKDVLKLISHGYSHGHWISHPDRDLIHTTAKLLATK